MKPDFARFDLTNMVQGKDFLRIFFGYDDWNAVIRIGSENVGRWWSTDGKYEEDLTLEEVKLLLMKYLNVGW